MDINQFVLQQVISGNATIKKNKDGASIKFDIPVDDKFYVWMKDNIRESKKQLEEVDKEEVKQQRQQAKQRIDNLLKDLP